MPNLTEFCKISGALDTKLIGKVAAGFRLDAHFAGTATSSHWEGERPVTGIDYVTVRDDGSMELNIRAVLGEGKEAVSYKATGVNPGDQVKELLLFETANEEMAWLNHAVGVALGGVDGDELKLTVYIVED